MRRQISRTGLVNATGTDCKVQVQIPNSNSNQPANPQVQIRNGGYNSRPHWYIPPLCPLGPLLTFLGNSKPRVIAALTPSSATTKAKANTSKPRDTKVAKPKAGTGAGVVKAKKPRTKTEKVVDKIVGTGEKVVGEVTGKPGKKVCFDLL